MELIVTEKDNAARRLSEILSNEDFDTERRAGVNVYRWGGTRCIGLSGHVVAVDFPPEYDDWRDVEPVELIDAPVRKRPTKEGIVRALRLLSRDADRVVIATDYDREGELIGKEAYELIREVNEDVPVDRVRFSSITEREVTEAFDDRDEIDFDLAAAGEARQIIDLIWGASLTRFLSLSARQLGDDFISVGRVQGPTLKLIVDREREIEAFDPEDYWELFADLLKREGEETTEEDAFGAQYFYEDDDGTEAERVWEEATADAVYDRLRDAGTATVSSVRRRRRTDEPPAPFNTTQFIRAASSIGYSAQRAMSMAEDLYTAGFMTYPRTDNTVYPEDLDERELLEELSMGRRFGDDAESVLELDDITPTEGDEETTDHPPIHPTGELPAPSELSDDEWEVYELVVRRFLATCAPDAEWEHLRVVTEIEAGDDAVGVDDGPLRLKSNGKRLTEEGYHAVYPYFSTNESYVPDVSEGEALAVVDTALEAKQTQPPRRYGQSRLIETMEDMGIGTKATRHDVIQKLYDRGYIESDPPRPTGLAKAVVEASEEFADRIVSDEMTAQLEADMQAIAAGEKGFEEVADESREMLSRVFEELAESREEVGDHLQTSLKADKQLGPCPECGDTLLVRKSRAGSYFVGCDGYPDCEYTLPLPSTGKPLILDEVCDDHGINHVKMLAGRKTFVHGCPQCQADEADEQEDEVIGVCPECGESAARSAADGDEERERGAIDASASEGRAANDVSRESSDSSEHGGELAIKRLRSGSRLVGCTRYPDCDYSLPLPRRGEIEVTDERCEEHDLPHLVVHSGDEPWELGCPICNYREYESQQGGSELETIDGIGEKTAEKLKDAGVDDVASLKETEPDALAEEVNGVGADTVRDWQAKAN